MINSYRCEINIYSKSTLPFVISINILYQPIQRHNTTAITLLINNRLLAFEFRSRISEKQDLVPYSQDPLLVATK